MSDALVVRYDKPRALGCSRHGCDGAAEWKVALLLVPSRVYAGKPWRFLSSNVVCSAHREKTADPFLDEDAWKTVLNYFASRGISPPHRTSTRVDYESIEGVEHG